MMEDVMAEDFIRETVEKVLQEIVKEKIENGASEEEIEKVVCSDNITKAFSELIKQASDDSVEFIEKIMYEKVLEERAYADEFLARQNQKWGKAFVTSDAMYICVLESAETYAKYVEEAHRGENSFMYYALKNIHARALQIYLEVMTLNKNGFADGAYARWRSLYELSVISAFITKYGENVAKAFVQAANTDDRYEWARTAKCFKKYPVDRHITFSAIQNKCELATKEWKKEYDFVNKLVHASPQGTMYRLGCDTAVALPVGRTDWGMSISAIHAAISLSQITADFFTIFSHGDSLMAMLTFHKWVEKIVEYYRATEEECFGDEMKVEIDNR